MRFDEFPQELVALLDKSDVSDRQRLVDDQHVGVDVRHHSERKAHRHAGGIGLDRLLDRIADVERLLLEDVRLLLNHKMTY